MLINFITNVIKYSPESQSVEIHVFSEGNDKVAVNIRDKGIGIDEQFHRDVFKKFYRVGVEMEETYSGFGIGL